jgi:hypothetical protein
VTTFAAGVEDQYIEKANVRLFIRDSVTSEALRKENIGVLYWVELSDLCFIEDTSRRYRQLTRWGSGQKLSIC